MQKKPFNFLGWIFWTSNKLLIFFCCSLQCCPSIEEASSWRPLPLYSPASSPPSLVIASFTRRGLSGIRFSATPVQALNLVLFWFCLCFFKEFLVSGLVCPFCLLFKDFSLWAPGWNRCNLMKEVQFRLVKYLRRNSLEMDEKWQLLSLSFVAVVCSWCVNTVTL